MGQGRGGEKYKENLVIEAGGMLTFSGH